MKKLIPALCMLLVAASMLGTSTFAWFSMNTTVTATNMEVKATASKNLMISKTTGSGYSSTVDMSISNATMKPVSTVGGDTLTPAFFVMDDAGITMDQNNAQSGDDTTFKTAATTDYVKTTVYLKCVGQNTTNLKVSFTTTTGGNKALDPAIRVMIVDRTNTKTYIYSPISGATYLTPGKAISGVDGSNKKQLGDITTAKTTTDAILATLTVDTEYAFDIYIWYEGEDVACKATNTVDMSAYKFAITFTVE